MATITFYATRVWYEHLDEIETFLNDNESPYTDNLVAHLTSVPDGHEVLLITTVDDERPMAYATLALESFTRQFEWRDRDDTLGPFTKAYKK